MIAKIELLHYLDEKTYKDICHKLQLDDSDEKIKDNCVLSNGSKVYKIHLFNIKYKAFGHIWFMAVHADFTKFDCDYKDFETELYTYYTDIFGEEVVSRLPKYDDINCNYIEYSTEVEVASSDTTIEKLGVKCTPEQLDKNLWDKYKKPHGTVATCFNKKIVPILKYYQDAMVQH